MILVIFSIIGVGIGVGIIISDGIEKKKKRKKWPVIVSLLSIAVCIAGVLTMINSDVVPIGDGQKVAVVYEQNSDKQTTLYYSEKDDEYFIILTHVYNPIDLSERFVIDKDTAERYVELYNELHSINMKG